jgi:MOSC domain-containing protein YiiM
MAGVVKQINVKPHTEGEHGLPKKPVSSARITRAGVEGDFNVYRHEERSDDPDQALLIMPEESIQKLNEEGWPIKAGDLGENLTTRGIPYEEFEVGKTFTAGGVKFQVSKPCDPCHNLYFLPYVGDKKGPSFLKVMLGRRGWYARVLQEGDLTAGDRIEEASG